MGRRGTNALSRRFSRARSRFRSGRAGRPGEACPNRAGCSAARGRATAARMGAPLRMAGSAAVGRFLEPAGRTVGRSDGRTAVRILVLVLIMAGCGGDSTKTRPIPGDRNPAITVEVLNARGRPGDARVGARLLPQAGGDGGYFANARGGGPGMGRVC